MPRGGHRSGAGRKPASAVLKFIKNTRGATPADPPPSPIPPSASPAPVETPQQLSPTERNIWDEWAPRAIAAGTLVATTVPAFILLCQLEADHRELRARVTPRERGPLLVLSENELAIRREVRALALAVRSGLKDFAIVPFGKEILERNGGEGEDPLDAFMRRDKGEP